MAKILIVIGFVLAFVAGVAMGPRIWPVAAPAPATRPSGPGGWLTAELNLTPAQQEQMKKIWSETAHRGGREQEDKRRQSRKERDDAIAGLIRPEDKEKYEAAIKAYADRQAAMEKEWKTSFQLAVEKTKQILSDEQRVKYETVLKNREAERAAREHDQGRRVEDRATSRPGTDK